MPSKPNTISFAVDDFGISPTANARILELALAGRIDRVAVMTEGLLPPEDIQQLLASGVKLDIHLEIRNPLRTGERKLSDSAFGRIITFLRGYVSGRIGAKSIGEQWDTQIKHFQTLFGRLPDGLNSHEHTHFFPPYFRALLSLADRHRIPYIRFGRRLNHESASVAKILNLLRAFDRLLFRRAKTGTSDYLVSYDWLRSWNDLQTYPDNTSIELIFHPERDEEMELLRTLNNL